MNYLVARVSDPEQRKSLPGQKKRLLAYAERMKWVETKDFKYIEFDETAFKENRRTFRELVIEPLKAETGLSVAVFDKIDRFSRDSSSDEKSELTRLYRTGKIEMHFPSDNLYIYKDSPAPDLFRLDIGIALAAYYSSAIRDNVKRRFDQMLADGIWVGKAPIGYLNYHETDGNGKLTKGIKIDTERNHLIRKGFELRSTGLPYKSVAKMMQKEGIRSKNKSAILGTAHWEKILKDKFYIGTMTYMGKQYSHNYPTFIEPWLWDKVQEANNKRSNGRTKYNSKPFLFKKLKCGTCGYSITFDGPKRGGNVYGRCTEFGGGHDAEWFNESILYEQVRAVLKSIRVPEKLLPDLINEIEKNHASEQKQYTSTKARLQKEYDGLDCQVKELFEDRKMFLTRPEMFEEMVRAKEVRQKEILQELEDHSKGDKAFVIGASYILDVCSRAVELFDAESSKLEQKRFLIDFVLSNMTMEGKNLKFTLKDPFNSIALMSKSGNWCPGLDSNQ